MRYKVKFFTGDRLTRETTARFRDWNDATFYLVKMLRYTFDSARCTFVKGTDTAEIMCQNGIPF